MTIRWSGSDLEPRAVGEPGPASGSAAPGASHEPDPADGLAVDHRLERRRSKGGLLSLLAFGDGGSSSLGWL